jgi:NAD(P)-dependent dehydrogenase (short-subunit alcohol dehydrogenase family)
MDTRFHAGPCRHGIIGGQVTAGFDGKTVLITGAASGLGAETARQFAAAGACLVLVDRNAPLLAATAATIRAGGAAVATLDGDVTHAALAEAAVALALAQFGAIDVLFCNAGIDPLTATDAVGTTEAQWDAVMDVNVKAAWLFARAALPAMIAAGGGAIINTASISAVQPSPAETVYSVSKSALQQLTKCIALDYAAHNIRANCICPGFLEAVMLDRRAELSPDRLAQRAASAEKLVPMRRQGRYDEIARAVLFFASSADASYITGASLVIDGGMTLA